MAFIDLSIEVLAGTPPTIKERLFQPCVSRLDPTSQVYYHLGNSNPILEINKIKQNYYLLLIGTLEKYVKKI